VLRCRWARSLTFRVHLPGKGPHPRVLRQQELEVLPKSGEAPHKQELSSANLLLASIETKNLVQATPL